MAKKILTKVLIAILLLSMLLSLAACGDPDTTTPTTTNGGDDDPGTPGGDKYPQQIKGLKDSVEGSVITFLFVEGGNGTYTADSIWVNPEAVDNDEIDEKVIERNNKVMEDLGVEIEPLEAVGVSISGLQEYAKTWFDTQDPEVDVYAGYQYYDISLATQGHLYDLNTLTNNDGDKIIDVSQPYWASNYINEITYNNHLYWVTGDLSFRYTGGLYCTFVNKTIYDQSVKSAFGGRTIYQVVNDGDWTMDTMMQMSEKAFKDNDNSGTATDGDQFGFIYEPIDPIDGIAFGCRISFGSKKTTNGKDEIVIELANDKKATELAGYLDTIYNATYAFNAGNADSKEVMPRFANGEALFTVNKLYMATVWLAEMDDYAIIPTPKLNDTQKDYASGVHDSVTLFGISKYSDTPEAAAATLELMSYYGSTIVTPAYYEKVLYGGRTIRDDEAAEMINLIRDGFHVDFVSAWSASLGGIVHSFRNTTTMKRFSNYLKIQSKSWPSALKKLTEELEKSEV